MKRFVLAGVATLGGFAVAIACGEPYEGEIPNTEVPGRDSGPGGDDAASDAPIATVDAAADAAPDVVDPCSDRDKDGFLAKQCEGGTDCDDDDKRAFPEAGFVSDLPTPATKGDWNCDTKVTLEYPTGLKCSDHQSDPVGAGCVFSGFKATPGCGESGDFVKCKAAGLIAPCQEESVTQVVQRCK